MTQQINMFGVRNKKWNISILQRQLDQVEMLHFSLLSIFCSQSAVVSLPDAKKCKPRNQSLCSTELRILYHPVQPQSHEGTHKLNTTTRNVIFWSFPFYILTIQLIFYETKPKENLTNKIKPVWDFIYNKIPNIAGQWKIQSLPSTKI